MNSMLRPLIHAETLAVLLALYGFLSPFAVASSGETPLKIEEVRSPNVVFIFADDWGWGDLSCHGHESFETPNLDRLAREGADFTEFTVANPVCSPSRTAVMTGHYPARHSIHRHFWTLEKNREFGMPDWLDPELVMLPRLFQDAGYKTGHFGKWHLCGRGYRGAPAPSAYGYDKSAVYGGPGPKADPTDASTFDETIAFLRTNRHARFFVNVWLHETHTPHFPKQRYLKKYAGLDERERVYAAIVAEADHGVGRILDTLDELDLSDETIVIFSSDNGPEQGSPSERHKQMENGLGLYYSVGSTAGMKGRKRSLYEGGVRVPFIVRWPGVTPAGVVDDKTVITAVDMLPTLCAAAHIALPQDGYRPDGESLLAAFMGREVQRKKPIFWEWKGPASVGWAPDPSVKINWPRAGVREEAWKLLVGESAGRTELYDVAADRAEENDVSASYPELVKRLSAAVIEWQRDLPRQPAAHCMSPDRLALPAP